MASSKVDYEALPLYEDEERKDYGGHVKSSNDATGSVGRITGFCFSFWECILTFLVAGLFSFYDSIKSMKNQFVRRDKWLSKEEYKGLFELSYSLPGISRPKLIMGVAMYRYGHRIAAALVAVFLYVTPGFMLMIVLGMVFSMPIFNKDHIPLWMNHAMKGLSSAGMSFAIFRYFILFSKMKTRFEHLITVIAATISLFYNPVWMLPVLIVLGSFASWIYLEIHDYVEQRMKIFMVRERVKEHMALKWHDSIKRPFITIFYFFQSFRKIPPHRPHSLSDQNSKESDQSTNQINHQKQSRISLGTNLLISGLILLFFVTLWISLSTSAIFVQKNTKTLPLHIAEFFYRMGALIFGGLRAGIPMLRHEMVITNKWMTVEQFMTGYALGNIFPGSFSNVACFYGVMIASTMQNAGSFHWISLLYGILAGIAFQLPGMLTFLVFQPLWNHIKDWKFLKRIVRGAQAVCIGFITSSLLHLWMGIVGTNVLLCCVIAVCLWLILSVNLMFPLIVLFGTVSGILLGFVYPNFLNHKL